MSFEERTVYTVVWERRLKEESGEYPTLLKARKKLDHLKELPGFVQGHIEETTVTYRTKEIHE